jgi:hypothetical protein
MGMHGMIRAGMRERGQKWRGDEEENKRGQNLRWL